MNKETKKFIEGFAAGLAFCMIPEAIFIGIMWNKKKHEESVDISEESNAIDYPASGVVAVVEKIAEDGSFEVLEQKIEEVKNDISEAVNDVVETVTEPEEPAPKKRGRKKKNPDIVPEPKESKFEEPIPKKKAKKKYDISPYEISQETYAANEPNFEHKIIWLDDQTLIFTDSHGKNVDYEKMIKFIGENNINAFCSDETQRFLYVRNEQESIDFEIIKE